MFTKMVISCLLSPIPRSDALRRNICIFTKWLTLHHINVHNFFKIGLSQKFKKQILANNITWLIMYIQVVLVLRKYKYNFKKWKYMLHSIFQDNLTHKLYHMPKYFYLQVAHDVLKDSSCCSVVNFKQFWPFLLCFSLFHSLHISYV